MHVTMFQSGKGDCLLLSNASDSARILVDGGVSAAYRAHVSPTLGKLRAAKKRIDAVYVSHIDDDHIGGVLAMLDDEVEWRVHDYQKKNGNPQHKAPKAARPPVIGGIWHNAFHEQLGKNAGAIEDALAASGPILAGSDSKQLRQLGLREAGLATSIRQAIQVSRRVDPKQLGIPLNKPANGKLMMFRESQQPFKVGGMRVTVIGPMESHLKKLRKDWNDWLRKSQKILKSIREAARKDEDRLGTSDFDRLLTTMKIQAEAFGDPESVTPPNLASLMLLVESGEKSMLLTGDARWDQVIEGLEATGKLQPGKTLAIDIVKVPHHGSENNIVETKLLDRVIGTHYLFCGNGEHGNPELDVLKLMAQRRLKAPGKFMFWFNSSEAVAEKPELADHMREAEKLVRGLAKASKGRMSFKFLKSGDSITVA